MGLIRAAIDSAKTTLADQWLEYFYCESLSDDVLVKKASKKVISGSNTKASENIITNGSGIAVNDGQAMIIVEDGKIVDFTVEPGRFTWDTSTEPSLFDNGLTGLKDSFKTFGKRFTMGGTPGKDQRVYFINLKEIFDNKFGSSTPMSYNDPTYRAIYIRYFGSYTFKIENPIVFYSNISANVKDEYTKQQLLEQCDAEFVNALDESLAKCSDEGFQFNDLPKRQREIAKFMNDTLDEEWLQRRGMAVESVAIAKVTPDDESRKRIQTIDDAIMMSDSRVAAGRLAGAQATAMENAASNEAGAFTGFLGMGMASNAGGNGAAMFQNMGQQESNPLFNKPTQANGEQGWACECGTVSTGKFCSECGKPKPEASTWTCSCGAVNTGKFCSECGNAKSVGGFACSNAECGFTSEENMKFCPNCGSANQNK